MMKKLLLTAAMAIASLAGNAQSAKLLADKIVGILGDKIVLRSDIFNYIEDIKRQGGDVPPDAECVLLEKMMADKALILQAEKDSLPVSDEEVEAELDQRIRYFIMQYGGKEAFEQIAGRTIYQVKEDFRKSIREGRLAQAMRKSIVENVKITPTEVRTFYEKIPRDSLSFYETELVVGQIVVYPKAGRELEKFAIDELLDYKKQVESGQKSFETLARLYTEDPGSRQTGGRYEFNKNDKTLDPNFKNGAFRLKEGQISPIIKSKFGYHIIQMISRNGDDAVIRHILRIPQITEEDIQASRVKLDSIRAKLIAGILSFGEAVDKYSEDENSKFTAGLISGQGGSFVTIDELDKDLVNDLKRLKVGEYSAPLTFTDEREKVGVRIVNLRSRTEPHRENLRDDYNRISQRALEEKKNKAIDKWFTTKLSTYYIMIDKDYETCEAIRKSFGDVVKK
ncbi:MAG: peptidylprolyl isomerase [Bacteroidetes bacterium]|nr:peptidylprolyl isomerase [Bacteroidota bacterium]